MWAECTKSEVRYAVDNLLQFLGDVLSNAVSGSPSKSKFVRRLERVFIVVVVMLIALVIYRIYAT